MINIKVLREICHSIRQNRVRTILSGFGISWGILILVVLLGSGKGLQDVVMNLFSVFAQKSIGSLFDVIVKNKILINNCNSIIIWIY